jgi:hypothetical protein
MALRPRRWLNFWRVWAAAGLVLAAAWYFAAGPAHHLDPTRPWRIEFGRGSGWHGLNTVVVASDGTAVLHSLRGNDREYWETITLRLPPAALADVVAAVEENRLLGLRRAYAASVHDGTQWVLWVVQGEYEKAVYFDNDFPAAIERFAAALDRILAANGSESADWTRVPDGDAREHERALWQSIKR